MNNPPAFPGVTYVSMQGSKNPEGMTLRDYFAAKAMQTMLGWDNDHTNWNSYAKDAYVMADAMLKAREA
jgi:hypothetical protein